MVQGALQLVGYEPCITAIYDAGASAQCKVFITLLFVSMVTVAYFIRIINICNIILQLLAMMQGI